MYSMFRNVICHSYGRDSIEGIHTLTAVLARTLYCSRTRSRSASLGILNIVMRSMGAIFSINIVMI